MPPSPDRPHRLLPCGELALLVEVADHHEALALYDHLRATPLRGVVDLVPAARTLLATFTDSSSRDAARAVLRGSPTASAPRPARAQVEVPVTYDGPDLAEVASLTGLTPEQVAETHCAADYLVAFTGFAPGFAYLVGLDPVLTVPRRDEPRARVPAGSVAVAGPYSAVYPDSSPGGWRLLGRTSLDLWSLDRDPPALLQPGTRVRFHRCP